MSAPVLIINGFELPQRSRLDYQQTFERVDGGSSSRRMASGRLFTTEHWEAWRTTISGGGWIPPALLSLRRGMPFVLHSVTTIALRPGEDLPAGWSARVDWPEHSITDERGVTVRLVFPVLTVVTRLGARLMTGGSNPSWELEMETP
ncbi:hypothetical protein [Azonexus sp.]|jgi:hypothetical protein|uniref:hypothetical protein n=1 Tax=Azonexus sp. TaxID=1872668 RepID=UPI0028356979|nr:hypothetical protein [Azonexus sp.]MDR1995155.1 hypothetical protein [Azonexus sp.]